MVQGLAYIDQSHKQINHGYIYIYKMPDWSKYNTFSIFGHTLEGSQIRMAVGRFRVGYLQVSVLAGSGLGDDFSPPVFGFGAPKPIEFGFGHGLSPESVFGAVSGFDFGFWVRVHINFTRSESAPLPSLFTHLSSRCLFPPHGDIFS